MKKILVLHAQVPFVRGGAEIMVEKLVEQLRIFGYDAELVQIPCKWYPENTFYDSLLMWSMIDLKESEGQKIDLVIATKFPSYGIQHPNKVVWLMHQHRPAYDLRDDALYSGLGTAPNGGRMIDVIKRYDEVHLNDAKRVYTISKNVSNRLKKYNNIPSTEIYHPPGLVGRYFCDQYKDYIFAPGRLVSMKRVDLLLKAVSKTDKKIKVKIAGTGSELANLQKLVKKLGIENRVEFLGYVSDEQLLELYSNAFAVYFAPVDEDYGYITLEAFLSKKPIITCRDAGGVLEFAEDGVNACVCEPSDEIVAKEISNLYNNKKKCEELGQNGYLKVKDITWKNVIEHLTYNI